MGKTEYRSAIRSRKLICNALGELMEEKPLDKITVTDVIRRADINRSTFYAHYENIPDVIEQQMKAACQTIQDAVSKRPITPGTPPDPLVILEQLQMLMESNYDFYDKIFKSDISEKLMERLRLFFSSYMLENNKVYQSAERDRYELVISCVSGCVVAMYQDWFSGRLTLTPDELTQEAAAVARLLLENMM